MRTVIWGANGAMGQLLQKALGEEVCGLVSLDGEKGVARNAQELPDVKPEAVIDFSHHSSVAEVTAYAISQGCPLVIGTTGHTEEEQALIYAAAEKIPVFYSHNMSLGIAVLCRIAWQIATGTGAGLLPPLVQSALSGLWMNILAALVMVLYLILHRQRAFWRALGKAAAWSAGILALLLGTAALNQGRLYRFFLAPSIRQLQDGDLNILFYWVTLWLVFLAGGLAVMQLIRSLTRIQLEARTLALRNSLLMSGYRTLERKMRESAAIRHESAHRLAALDAMLQKGDLDKLAESLAVWRQASDAAAQPIFTPNLVVNAILQDAAGRAQESGIAFQAVAAVPEHLPFPDEDLCTLLMNLLDNALEGAERTPEGRRKAVSCKLALDGGVLSVLCENTYDGHVSMDLDGALRTTKADSAFHGFGLPQMRAVVQKYKSALDLHYTDSTFMVQAALPVPKRAREAV